MSDALSMLFFLGILCLIFWVLFSGREGKFTRAVLIFGAFLLVGSILGSVSLFLSHCFSGDTSIAVGCSFFFGVGGYFLAAFQTRE
jgi:hypothetical protein